MAIAWSEGDETSFLSHSKNLISILNRMQFRFRFERKFCNLHLNRESRGENLIDFNGFLKLSEGKFVVDFFRTIAVQKARKSIAFVNRSLWWKFSIKTFSWDSLHFSLHEIHSCVRIFPLPNYPVHYCFAVIYLRVTDVYVMMLIKQNKTMIFISQPHAIPYVNVCCFHYESCRSLKNGNQRADSLFRLQRSGGWGCSDTGKERLFTMFPLKHEKLSRAELHGWVRTKDVLLIGLMTQNPREWNGKYSAKLRCFELVIDAGKKMPPLVTALTALIINGFFIRNRRSLDLPRDLNRSRERSRENHFSS